MFKLILGQEMQDGTLDFGDNYSHFEANTEAEFIEKYKNDSELVKAITEMFKHLGEAVFTETIEIDLGDEENTTQNIDCYGYIEDTFNKIIKE